jgi:hypothetical protein
MHGGVLFPWDTHPVELERRDPLPDRLFRLVSISQRLSDLAAHRRNRPTPPRAHLRALAEPYQRLMSVENDQVMECGGAVSTLGRRTMGGLASTLGRVFSSSESVLAETQEARHHNLLGLPEAVLVIILGNLPVREQCRCARTCKTWRRIVRKILLGYVPPISWTPSQNTTVEQNGLVCVHASTYSTGVSAPSLSAGVFYLEVLMKFAPIYAAIGVCPASLGATMAALSLGAGAWLNGPLMWVAGSGLWENGRLMNAHLHYRSGDVVGILLDLRASPPTVGFYHVTNHGENAILAVQCTLDPGKGPWLFCTCLGGGTATIVRTSPRAEFKL